jgi:hypothetical protein
MDHGRFDDLTRSVSGASESRRAVLRLLTGGAMAGLAARLGLADETGANDRYDKRKAKPHRKARRPGAVQTQGKHKGKGNGKGKKKAKPKPPCGPGEHRCGPGPCIPSTVCCSDQTRCPDGSCVAANACCPHERPCGDDLCIPADSCCPDEWRCGDDSCVPSGECCPDEWQCGDGSCVTEGQCCAGEKPCGNGVCVSDGQCCPGEMPCEGECIPEDACCELDLPPICLEGQALICCKGESRCVNHWEREDPPCGIYRQWLTFNSGTCQCECPGGTVGHPLTPYCCPASHPIHSDSSIGCGNGVWNDWICPIGFAPCPEQPWVCCLSSPWPTASD